MPYLPSHAVRAIVRPPAIGLGVVVVVWWLLIAVTATAILPPPVLTAAASSLVLVPGRQARIAQRGIRDWPVPTSRAAYDEFQRGFAAADETAIDRSFAIAEWVPVNHGDAVRIAAVDGDVVEIELLQGGYAGRRAWLQHRQLTPLD